MAKYIARARTAPGCGWRVKLPPEVIEAEGITRNCLIEVTVEKINKK